jgi:transcriptional regulator with XRE-family HTH domain
MHSALEPQMWDAAAGEELRNFRIERGWSQARLAAEIECDQSTVSRIENGEPPNRAVKRLIEIIRLAAERAA